MRFFRITDEQLLELHDCVMDGNLPKFEQIMEEIRKKQEIWVSKPERN
jgi:hypothetical protein